MASKRKRRSWKEERRINLSNYNHLFATVAFNNITSCSHLFKRIRDAVALKFRDYVYGRRDRH